MAVPSFSQSDIAEWRNEKERLQKLAIETQHRLQAVNQLINAALYLSPGASSAPAAPSGPSAEAIDPSNFMGTLAQLINSSPKPLQRNELKKLALAAGVDVEKVNSQYFHVALNRMKDAKRITIRDDGSVWHGDRRS